MKKLSVGYLGLLGIPLALLGVVTSVAMAAPKVAPPTAQTVIGQPAQTAQVSDTDTETNDTASETDTDTETPGTPETNDDGDGPEEAPGTEVAD